MYDTSMSKSIILGAYVRYIDVEAHHSRCVCTINRCRSRLEDPWGSNSILILHATLSWIILLSLQIVEMIAMIFPVTTIHSCKFL